MPVRIKCKCGKVLTVPDEFRGKSVKCPGCTEAVRVPAEAAATKPGAGAAAKPGAAGRAKPAAAKANSDLDDLFSEEGFNRVVVGVCPACGAEMPAEGVFCTKCGYNKQTGERLESHKVAGVDIGMGTIALAKAKQSMADDKDVQDRMLKRSGMPWWMLALVLFVLASGVAIATLAVNSSRRVEEAPGYDPMGLFLLMSGVAFALVSSGAGLMILVKAFQRSWVTGLLCFVPLYVFVFCFKNWSATWRLLLTNIFAGAIAGGLLAAASQYFP